MAEVLDEMSRGEVIDQGIPTGFTDLDDKLIGLQPGEMSIVAARPSVGKTMFALNVAEHLAVTRKIEVAFFSIEMRMKAIMERLICARAGVDSQKFKRNTLSLFERKEVSNAFTDLRDARLFINDASSMTVMDLRAKARRLKRKHGIKLVIIDYLQLMDAGEKAENRQQEITRISRGIKTLAGELGVHVMCLSQLNRASATENRRPRPSDLRESGSIEQDADVVMLLHREEVANREDPSWAANNPQLVNVAELIIAKQRNGPCGVITLTVDPKATRFLNHAYAGEK